VAGTQLPPTKPHTKSHRSTRVPFCRRIPQSVAAALRVLRSAMRGMALSARGYDRVRKVARTIADLAGHEAIGADHVAEALQFRLV